MVSERDKARPDQDDTRERAIFAACLDLPTEAREPHLERACNGDARLKSRLRRLLAVHRAVAEVEKVLVVVNGPSPVDVVNVDVEVNQRVRKPSSVSPIAVSLLVCQ